MHDGIQKAAYIQNPTITKPDREKPLPRCWLTWEDNIKMEFKLR
jgi:hypothetical protein